MFSLVLAELFIFWVLSLLGRGGIAIAPAARFLLGFWWLWLGLTVAVGFVGLAVIRVILTENGLVLDALGIRWQELPWRDARQARILKVGRTVAVLAEIEDGRFCAWRQGILADPEKIAAGSTAVLGERLRRTFPAPYRTKRGTDWTIDGNLIRRRRGEVSLVLTPETVLGIKFLFVEGDDLPLRILLFRADGAPAEVIRQDTSFFPFLAADILRLAKRAGIKTACVDLGKNRPRMFAKAGGGRVDPVRPPLPRAWELEAL